MFSIVVVGLPCAGGPDFCSVASANNGEFTLEACVVAQRRRNRDPVLLIGNFRTCTREKKSQEVSAGFARQRRLSQALHMSIEILGREDVDASLLTSGQDKTVRELLTKPCRKDDSTLVVELRGVCSQKHLLPLSYPATLR